MAAGENEGRSSGMLDAIEGLAFEIEHVQQRVARLEHRMDRQEADPGPELIARRTRSAETDSWASFEARAGRVIDRLRDLEQAAGSIVSGYATRI